MRSSHELKEIGLSTYAFLRLASNSLNQMTNIIEELQNLEKLSESNSIDERHLVDFSILIEQEKHYLPVTTRPELRERILALKSNQYDNAETLITSVADSIYKLPESRVSNRFEHLFLTYSVIL